MKAVLALADGTILRGQGFGAEKEVAAEVVFNTSMVGYEESLTDPSYAGQILISTYPLIGNYGVRGENFESDKVQVDGFVVRELCNAPQHRDSTKTVDAWLKEHDIPGISGVDTRMLVRKIREFGVINGALVTSENEIDVEKVLQSARKAGNYSEKNLLEAVSVKAATKFSVNGAKTIAAIDTGIKHSIIRSFNRRGVNVILLPHGTKADELEQYKFDGLFFANGPGDPERAKPAIKLIQDVCGKYPINAICLGHQLIALALDGKTYKLKFGHRGINQPVKSLAENKIYITSQNHGFAVDADSLNGTGLEISHINLNDNSVEGMVHKKLNIQTVQFHPEASPGPWDTQNIFDRFVKNLK
jgi:carbamoyl-phosphate synthase small subunit